MFVYHVICVPSPWVELPDSAALAGSSWYSGPGCYRQTGHTGSWTGPWNTQRFYIHPLNRDEQLLTERENKTWMRIRWGYQWTFRLKTWCKLCFFESNLNVGAHVHLGWQHTNSMEAPYVFFLLFYYIWRRSHHLLQLYWIWLTLFTLETPKVFCGLKHFTHPSIAYWWVDNEWIIVNYPFKPSPCVTRELALAPSSLHPGNLAALWLVCHPQTFHGCRRLNTKWTVTTETQKRYTCDTKRTHWKSRVWGCSVAQC